MASRRQLQGASSNRRHLERGQSLPHFPNMLTATDKVPASATASTLRKHRPCRPPRRSPRLNRLPQLDKVTSQAAEQPPVITGGRRSLRPRPQPSAGCAIKLSEPTPSHRLGWSLGTEDRAGSHHRKIRKQEKLEFRSVLMVT